MSIVMRDSRGDRVVVSYADVQLSLLRDFGPTLTEQSHKDTCDVNRIVLKYDKTGLITHVSEIEAKYGDVPSVDFKAALDLSLRVQADFEKFPSSIRNRFDNSPAKYLEFMDNASNRDEAISLGLIRGDSLPSNDGLGEKAKPDVVAPADAPVVV